MALHAQASVFSSDSGPVAGWIGGSIEGFAYLSAGDSGSAIRIRDGPGGVHASPLARQVFPMRRMTQPWRSSTCMLFAGSSTSPTVVQLRMRCIEAPDAPIDPCHLMSTLRSAIISIPGGHEGSDVGMPLAVTPCLYR